MKHYLPLVFLLAVCPNIVLASDKAVHEGKQLVEQAEAKANIFALPSFAISADIRISDGDKDLNGLTGCFGMGLDSGGRRSVFQPIAKFR